MFAFCLFQIFSLSPQKSHLMTPPRKKEPVAHLRDFLLEINLWVSFSTFFSALPFFDPQQLCEWGLLDTCTSITTSHPRINCPDCLCESLLFTLPMSASDGHTMVGFVASVRNRIGCVIVRSSLDTPFVDWVSFHNIFLVSACQIISFTKKKFIKALLWNFKLKKVMSGLCFSCFRKNTNTLSAFLVAPCC